MINTKIMAVARTNNNVNSMEEIIADSMTKAAVVKAATEFCTTEDRSGNCLRPAMIPAMTLEWTLEF